MNRPLPALTPDLMRLAGVLLYVPGFETVEARRRLSGFMGDVLEAAAGPAQQADAEALKAEEIARAEEATESARHRLEARRRQAAKARKAVLEAEVSLRAAEERLDALRHR